MTNENALNILEHYQISIYSISKFADKVYELRLIRNENSVTEHVKQIEMVLNEKIRKEMAGNVREKTLFDRIFGPKKETLNLRGKLFATNFKDPHAGGWKRYSIPVIIGLSVLAFLYPVVVDPMLHVDKYKKMHEYHQTELFQAGLLPGQLKKWEDPWKSRRGD